MTNKEQIKRDIAVAMDFVGQLLEKPEMLDKIPEGTTVTFLDDENVKPEKSIKEETSKKYIQIKRHFVVL